MVYQSNILPTILFLFFFFILNYGKSHTSIWYDETTTSVVFVLFKTLMQINNKNKNTRTFNTQSLVVDTNATIILNIFYLKTFTNSWSLYFCLLFICYYLGGGFGFVLFLFIFIRIFVFFSLFFFFVCLFRNAYWVKSRPKFEHSKADIYYWLIVTAIASCDRHLGQVDPADYSDMIPLMRRRCCTHRNRHNSGETSPKICKTSYGPKTCTVKLTT